MSAKQELSQAEPSASASAVEFYRERIAQHGYSYRAQWGDDSEWKWRERFGPLALLPIVVGQTLVDIGCGTGQLGGELTRMGRTVTYVGVDVVPEFVEQANRRQGVKAIVHDAFKDPDGLPPADWYVSFGTLNKEWCLTDLPGSDYQDKIFRLVERLFRRARVGVAFTLVTSVVEYSKPGVCNVSPTATASFAASLTPHFLVYHGYAFYEFFVAAWKGTR